MDIINNVNVGSDSLSPQRVMSFLAIRHIRNGEEWYILPEKAIAVVRNKTSGALRACRPMPYMMDEAFWAAISGKESANQDWAGYIDYDAMMAMEEIYAELLENTEADDNKLWQDSLKD